MKKHIPLAICWLVNSLVVYLLSGLFPNKIVLGNEFLSPLAAVLITGLLVMVIDHLGKHANAFKFKLKKREYKFGYYLAVNTVAFWLLARIPFLTGYGIARFYWAIVLGVVTTIVQWLIRQGFKKGKLI